MDLFGVFIQYLFLSPFIGLVIWFWVLVFKLLIKANKALEIYLNKAK